MSEKTRSERIEELIFGIRRADPEAMRLAEERQAKLAKPPGALGELERISVRLAGMTGKVKNSVEKRTLLVFAADNGVVSEGVSSAPQSVTLSQTVNLTRGLTGAATLARHFNTELRVIDVGVNAEVRAEAVIPRKIACGTANIRKGPAMSREQAEEALLVGAEEAEKAVLSGAEILGVGEMGIGNTTTSSAVIAVLTGKTPEEVTGKGGGITDEAYLTKLQVIRDAIRLNAPDRKDPLDVLRKVGGFDIAAMAGAFLGAAKMRVPAVVDGFISVAAALAAYRLCPAAKDYMIASHASYEIGYRAAVSELGLRPLFDLSMRLGEGSGCPLAFSMVSAATAVMNEMATFDEAGIDDGYLSEIREGDKFTVEKQK